MIINGLIDIYIYTHVHKSCRYDLNEISIVNIILYRSRFYGDGIELEIMFSPCFFLSFFLCFQLPSTTVRTWLLVVPLVLGLPWVQGSCVVGVGPPVPVRCKESVQIQ